jgi:hypothetical protein
MSRRGHIYLGTEQGAELAMAGVLICHVDLVQLHPDYIDADENKVGAHGSHDQLAHLQRASELRPRRESEAGGDWALEHAHIIDQPEWVAFSLSQGAIAYAKPIPPSAITIDPEFADAWETAAPGAVYGDGPWREPMPFQLKSIQ